VVDVVIMVADVVIIMMVRADVAMDTDIMKAMAAVADMDMVMDMIVGRNNVYSEV
jgi:hypothetical protein